MANSLELRDSSAVERPDEYVREMVLRAGSSFLWGMRLLPPSRRRAMYAIYAFCRAVDDVADGQEEETHKLAQLESWRKEVDLLFTGKPKHPIMRALVEATRQFGLPKAEFLAVIDGMEMDVRNPAVAPSLSDFQLYCRRVAGAVGLLSIHAFGAKGEEAEELAIVEGEALQITNILRDLQEDAAVGRLYVPREYLEAQNITDRNPKNVLADPRFAEVHKTLCAEARQRFARARQLIRRNSGSSLRPARLMLEIYSRLLERIDDRGWPGDGRRVRVPRAVKLWLVLRYGLI